MPGGLPEVTQPFSSDWSNYLPGFDQAIGKHSQLNASIRETLGLMREMASVRASMDASGMSAMLQQVGQVKAALGQLPDAKQIRVTADVREALAANRQLTESAGRVGAGYESVRAVIAGVGSEAQRASGIASAAAVEHAGAAGEIAAAYEAGRRAARAFAGDIAGTAAGAEASASRVRDAAAAAADLTRESVRAAAAQSSLREESRLAAEALGRNRAAALSAVAFTGSGSQGTGWAPISSPDAAVIARNLAARGLGPNPASSAADQAAIAAAMSAMGGGSGGGGFVPSSRGGGSSASGGGGGGGGGLPGGGGGFVPWRGGGWQAVRFWGMMTAEVASTVVPALAAAGSAALVGMQGMEQLSGRYKAIASVSEALGGAFGKTTGSVLGIGSGLQQAQNFATGGVYELGGAGINLLKSGGGGFLQQGINTIAMLDRAAAGIQPGLGQKISGALGGGTEYLQQFGSIGANLGTSLLNVAPNLPGVGADLLTALQGGTGLARSVTGGVPSALMKGFLTYEAASRWGPALLGGQGLIGRMLGLRGVGGVGGLLGRGGEALAARGLGGVMGDVGLGMIGTGDALAALTGPEIGLPLAAIQAEFAGLNQLPAGAGGIAAGNIAGWQSQIAKGGFTGAWQPLAHAITRATGLAAATGGASSYAGPTRTQMASRVGIGLQAAYARSPESQYAQAASSFTQTMTDLIGAGPRLVDALHKAGLKSVSMAEAFQIAQNALLDTSHAFGKDGKLTKAAAGMITNYVAALGPMTQSGGAFGAAVAGQYIMSQPAMKTLSQTNQAMSSMTQIMTGGPVGMAGLIGQLGGLGAALGPVINPLTAAQVKAGRTTATPASTQQIAKALSDVTTLKGAAAWQQAAGPQGLIPAEQANLDQLRTELALGAITQHGAAGLAGFQIQKMLPLGKQSPGMLATIMSQGAQMGVTPYYDPSKSLAANYKIAAGATKQIADNSKQANAATQSSAVTLSRLPHIAAQFSQGFKADVMSQQAAAAATSFSKITSQAGKGLIDRQAIGSLTGQLKTAFGGSMSAVRAQIQQSLSTSGLSGGMQKKIMVQVDGQLHMPHIPKPPDQHFNVNGRVHMPSIPKIPNQSFIVTGHVVMTGGPKGGAGQVSPYTPAGAQANLGPAAYFHPAAVHIISQGAGAMPIIAQTGRFIPGYGGGDIVPAMLEPGELVVPKHLVGSVAPTLSGKIPGFAAGGIAGGLTPQFFSAMMLSALSGDAVKNNLKQTIDGLIGQGLTSHGGTGSGQAATWTPVAAGGFGLPKTPAAAGGGIPASATAAVNHAATQALHSLTTAAKGPGGQEFSVQILKGIAAASIHGFGLSFSGNTTLQQAYTKALQGQVTAAAASAAKALVSRIQAEVGYAKSTASSLTGGLNFGGMDTTQGPVQTQMQSYASSLKAFSKDIANMSKAGLNKDLLKQMIAAGPVQGDALAQSIQTGPGGVAAVNKLYAGIQHLAGKIGAQAGHAVYGGALAPNLKSGTFVSNNNVTINVSSGSATTLGGLSDAQIKQLTHIIQGKLLKQAKQNRRTGTTLPGYGP